MQAPGELRSVTFAPVFALSGVVLGWSAWADVGFRDSGELGTAAFELGVAHPTGFAVDLLLLRAASLMPVGSIALRQNALVALQAALVLGLLAALSERLAARLGLADGWPRRLGAVLPAAALLGWSTFRATATAVEVYTLALLLVVSAGYGLARGGRSRGLWACVAGFAPGLHVTAGAYALLLGLGHAGALGARRALPQLRAHAPVVLAGAAIALYLPLASSRDPTLDWGDPETFARVIDHLTAARIRSAYAGEMLGQKLDTVLPVLELLAPLALLLPLIAIALVLGAGRAPRVVLGPLALVAVDLGYAAWVNPMGAVDGQVGHVAGAGLCLLAGLGFVLAYQALRARGSRVALCVIALLLATTPAWSLAEGDLREDFAASELFGSGGPLATLPPRSVVVCGGDDACAAGLFALHVEAVRPDVDVAPAQHLWDPTVLRRLEGLGLQAGAPPAAGQRRARADANVMRLARAGSARPVVFTDLDALRRAGVPQAAPARVVPYVVGESGPTSGATAVALADPLAGLTRLLRARYGRDFPRAPRSRLAWSSAHATLGVAVLPRDPALGVRALRSAAEIDPGRSSAWTNLGVALEAQGEFAEAVKCAERALQLEPSRPTPWVNLVRLQVRLGRPDVARQLLRLAEDAGVRDARLDQLAARVRE